MRLFRRVSRRRTPVFYGWVIVAVMATAGGINTALGTVNFGLFIKPMGDELGITRAMFGWAMTARQVAAGLTGPVLGRLIDRFGTRILLAAAVAVAAGVLVGLAHVTYGWQVAALLLIMGLVGMQGPGSLLTGVPVTKWFIRRRGRAMAITAVGTPVAAIVLMPLTQLFIDWFGWRHAWLALAALGAAILIPLSLVFVRRQPEDMGLAPDGDTAAAGPAANPGGVGMAARQRAEEVSWTVSDATRSLVFWRLVGVFTLEALALGTVSFHRIPNFMDRGIDPHLVSLGISVDATMLSFSTLTMGLLVERFPARFVGAVGYVLLATSVFFYSFASTAPMMFMSMAIWGTGIGAGGLVRNYLLADYFGRRHQGSIQGFLTPMTLVVGGIGAPVAGYVRDITGSYGTIWVPAASLMVVGALLLAFTPPPKDKPLVQSKPVLSQPSLS
ncbi:MAG: MFS transporter [Chloroflexi bacterium]|nr:MFS transporter [Chloroflexota bacterium]